MTDPIIVPISTPGGAEAAAQTRRFAGAVVEAAGAQDKLDATTRKAAAGVHAEEAATKQSTQAHQHHIRTLAEQIEVEKRLEHQRALRRQAQATLGESFNVQDLGAMRRLARGFGGIGGEIGRGTVEGIEGVQGGGLRSVLGLAGAGVAGGTVAFEGLREILDRIKEEFNYELDLRRSIRERLVGLQHETSETGSGVFKNHGDALRALSSFYGNDGKAMGQMAERAYGDPTAVQALADSSARFGAGSPEQIRSMQLANILHQLGGGDMSKLVGGMDFFAMRKSLGRGLWQSAADLYGKSTGRRYTGDQIHGMVDRATGSGLGQELNTIGGLSGDVDAASIDLLPQAESGLRDQLARMRSPATAAAVDNGKVNEKSLQDARASGAQWDAVDRFAHGWWFSLVPEVGATVRAARQYANWAGVGPDYKLEHATNTNNEQVAALLEQAANLLRSQGRTGPSGSGAVQPGQAATP